MTNPRPATLLFVDDEFNVLKSLKRLFVSEGHRILVASHFNEALDVMEKEAVDLICCDYHMDQRTGLELLEEVRGRWPRVTRMMLTGSNNPAVMRDAVEKGAVYKFIGKPWDDEDLKVTVRRALEHGSLVSAHHRLKDHAVAQDQIVQKIDRLWDRHQGTLAYLLEKAGVATAEQIATAGREREYPETLIETLARMKVTTEARVLKVLTEAQNIDGEALEGAALQPEALRLVPRAICEKGRLTPLRIENDKLVVAFADPTDVVKIENLGVITGYPIRPVAAAPSAILSALARFYDDAPAYASLQEFEKQVNFDPDGKFDLIVSEETPNELDQLFKATDEASTVRLVNAIIYEGLKNRASDIHFEPKGSVSVVRYRVDGVLQTRLKIPGALHAPTLSRIKVLAKLDIAERRRPQDGRLTLKAGARLIDVRLSTMPTVEGEKLVMRILDTSAAIKSVADIGLSPLDRLRVTPLLHRPQGIILSTGPTGSGKTTTLYAAMNETLSPFKNYETIEDPVEYRLKGANQVQVRENLGVTFAAALRCTLRQDPDVILLGEIRDAETADVAFKAAMTGHLVLSTLHTNGTVASLTRLVDIGIQPFLIASTLEGIIAQRLARRICDGCRRPAAVSAETLALLGLAPEQAPPSYQGAGCDKCGNSGYKGRVGLFELMVLNEDMRRCIAGGVNEAALASLARASGMRTLVEDGIEKVKEGVTTWEELLRVVGPPNRFEEPCRQCRKTIDVNFSFCPLCGDVRKRTCGACRRELESHWRHCPGCGHAAA